MVGTFNSIISCNISIAFVFYSIQTRLFSIRWFASIEPTCWHRYVVINVYVFFGIFQPTVKFVKCFTKFCFCYQSCKNPTINIMKQLSTVPRRNFASEKSLKSAPVAKTWSIFRPTHRVIPILILKIFRKHPIYSTLNFYSSFSIMISRRYFNETGNSGLR